MDLSGEWNVSMDIAKYCSDSNDVGYTPSSAERINRQQTQTCRLEVDTLYQFLT